MFCNCFIFLLDCTQIRGMSIDEALKQLLFYKRKGGSIVREVTSVISKLLESADVMYMYNYFM